MEAITFRRVTRADFPLIARWLAEPHVARWWNHEFSTEAVERDFGPSVDGSDPSENHLVLLEGRPIGLIQFYMYDDYPEYRAELAPLTEVPGRAASIDYFIGDGELTGKGLGARMIAAFTRDIWQTNPTMTCIIVPVSSANEASWRALLRTGFRPVARGDLPPDNPIDDPSHEILRLNRPQGS